MLIKDLIYQENLRREANNPRVIFITYQYQGPTCKVFDMHYANLLPIEADEFIKDLRKYGKYLFNVVSLKSLSLNSDISEDIFNSFLSHDVFSDVFGLDHNYHKRYQLCNSESIVFSNECTEVMKKSFDELVQIYTHIPDLKTSIGIDIKHTYTFKSEEERDIFGHALLDGLSEVEAYALTQGIEINPDKIPFVGGYYSLKEEYRKEYESMFGVRR